jgi:hypothetical protein
MNLVTAPGELAQGRIERDAVCPSELPVIPGPHRIG